MSEQNLNEVMVEETTETVNPIMMDENETSVEYSEDPHESKVGAFIGGAALTVVSIALYKRAVKPGIKWVKGKVTGLMSKKKEETESEKTTDEEVTEVKK